jgi:mono/diheme cytochrome c family protein
MTRKMMRTGFALLAAALGVALAPGQSHAQARQSVWDGVYSDAQADRGKGQYAQHCAVCHGAALEGNGESPPLTGEFIPDWAGTTLADLYDKIETTMPLNAPGTLRPAIAADILAYLLKENNFPAGQKELDTIPAALGTVSFDVTKPKPAARPSRGRVQQ